MVHDGIVSYDYTYSNTEIESQSVNAAVDSTFLCCLYWNCTMSTGNLSDQLYALMEEAKRVHEDYVQRAIALFNRISDDDTLCTPDLEGFFRSRTWLIVSVALFVSEKEILNDTYACLASIIFSLQAGD